LRPEHNFLDNADTVSRHMLACAPRLPALTEPLVMTSSFRRLLSSGAFLALALVPSAAGAVTQSYCSFPAPLTTWTLNQNAFEALNSEIRLTGAVANEIGTAWLNTPIALGASTSFHAYFRFKMGPNAAGGDGLAFVLHNAAAGTAAIGTGAIGMGYGGITPSVIVEFDTFKNGTTDTNGNHVGLMLNGSSTTHTAVGTPSFTMANAGVLNAWVDYDAAAHQIKVYLSQSATKPGTALITNALNLQTQLGAQMYVGFTSATGTGTELNQHDVYELEISTDGIPCTCEGDTACGGSTPACAASGICAVCSATNQTACTGATPVCNVPVNTCVGCLTNANCGASKPICDKGTLTCRACANNADCGGSTPECATTGPNAGRCVACISDADCGGATPRCSPSSNTCVQCLGAADCGGNTPVCNAGTCQACSSDADCGGATPACEVWGACGQCSPTNASACMGGTAVCDYPTGTCVACEFDSDCGGNTPICDGVSHTCKPCQSNADCAGNAAGPACVLSGMKAGSCVTCVADADCPSAVAPKCDPVANYCVQCLTSADCGGATPVCNGSNLCVQCLSNADCSGATPICDTASSTCKPCQNDYAAQNPGPLACPTAAAPACQPAGSPLAGQCGLCSSLNNSACATLPATPVCIAATASCGCVKDTDCNADFYCDTSAKSTGVCAAGCREVGGLDNCATGKYCTKTDGSVGTCMSEPCNQNADCSAPNPICDTIDQPHVCVECLNETDCPAGKVCDPARHCVECTAMQTKNCDPAGKGAACLASETCGCATDTDCGIPTSGRVCDGNTHTCTTGCRGMGGNGCPAPETCSSSDGSIGTCQSGSSSSSSGMGGAGAGGGHTGGQGGGVGEHVVSQSVGCGCRTAPEGDARTAALAALAGLALIAARRARRVK
jgi:MYXO-CTERM domain-containing protein